MCRLVCCRQATVVLGEDTQRLQRSRCESAKIELKMIACMDIYYCGKTSGYGLQEGSRGRA